MAICQQRNREKSVLIEGVSISNYYDKHRKCEVLGLLKILFCCYSKFFINDFMSIALSKMSYIPTNYFEIYIPNISLDASSEIALGYIDSFYGQDPKGDHNLFPIAIRTYKINPRIEAQKGVFLIYPRERKSSIALDVKKVMRGRLTWRLISKNMK